MAYSRWCSSRWYTYWQVAAEGVVENRGTAVFCVCTVAEFTARDLRTNMDECLEKVKSLVSDATDVEMGELCDYMQEFLRDVDNKYRRRHK